MDNKYTDLVRFFEQSQSQGATSFHHKLRRFIMSNTFGEERRRRIHPRTSQMMLITLEKAMKDTVGGKLLGVATSTMTVDIFFIASQLAKYVGNNIDVKLIGNVDSESPVYPYVKESVAPREGMESINWDILLLDSSESLSTDIATFAKGNTTIIIFTSSWEDREKLQTVMAGRKVLMAFMDMMILVPE